MAELTKEDKEKMRNAQLPSGSIYGGGGFIPRIGGQPLASTIARGAEADPSRFVEGSLPNLAIRAGQNLRGVGDVAADIARTSLGRATEFITGMPSPNRKAEAAPTPTTTPMAATGLKPEDVAGLSISPSVPPLTPESITSPDVPSPMGALEGLSGEEGSPQRAFYDFIAGGGQLTPEKVAEAEAYAASMGTTFDPATGYSRDPFLQSQEPSFVPTTPAAPKTVNDLVGFKPTYEGQSLADFIAYRDDPSQATRPMQDPQGRLIRVPVQDQQAMGQPSVAPQATSILSAEDIRKQAEEGVESLGYYRNITRGQGIKGSAQIAAAKEMREAAIAKRVQRIEDQQSSQAEAQQAQAEAKSEAEKEAFEREEAMIDKESKLLGIEEKRRGLGLGDGFTFDQEMAMRRQSLAESEAIDRRTERTQKREAEQSQYKATATAAIQGAIQNLNLMEEVGEEIRGMTYKNLTEGNFARAAAIISPTSTAAQIERLTETLTGDAFVESILELKSMGGTVGQVSNEEGRKLQAAKQRLMKPGMGDKERRVAVENYLQTKRQSVQNLHNAYVGQYGPDQAKAAFGKGGGEAQAAPRYSNDQNVGGSIEDILLPKS